MSDHYCRECDEGEAGALVEIAPGKYRCPDCGRIYVSEKPKTKAKTVRVRAAVGVTPDGRWEVSGFHLFTDERAAELASFTVLGSALYWIEADVPVPQETVIEGVVSDGPLQE